MINIYSESKIKEALLFPMPPPGKAYYFMKQFSNYELEGRFLEGKGKIKILAIHGGMSDYTSLNPILYTLQQNGIGSLSFNLSGHSPSTKHIQSSLKQNIDEAAAFAESISIPEVVMGYSLGGYVALQLARQLNIRKILLFCPAIYTDDAVYVPYGKMFTQKISQAYSYMDSELWAFLENYNGKLFLITGEFDGWKTSNGKSKGYFYHSGQRLYSPIPYEVKQRFKNIIYKNQNMKKEEIIGADHFLADYFKKNTSNYFIREIIDFVCQE